MTLEREIELKLEVSPEALERMKCAVPTEGFSQSEPQIKWLKSLYFDTPDQALRQRRISLRVREIAPDQFVQTLKLGTGVTGGLSRAIEIERPVTGRGLDLACIDDPKALAVLVDALAGKPLLPAFETVIERTTRTITAHDETCIEVAFDSGEIVAGQDRTPLAELELELQSGSPEALFSAAEWIAGSIPFRFSPYNKSERGFRFVTGAPAESAVRRADTIKLKPSRSTETAFVAILSSCLTQVSDNRLAVLQENGTEAPHQLRVGLRRLRSAFRLFRPLLVDDPWAAGLADEARELAASVETVRNLDVLQLDIVAPVEKALPGSLNCAALLTTLAAQRDEAHQLLVDRLHQSHWNRFLLALTAYLSLRGWRETASSSIQERWNQPLETFANEALAKQWKKVIAYGDRLDDLDIPERHEMRKALKKLRYGLEFFGSLYPQPKLKPYLRQLRKLQNVFGYLNDVAMAERLLDHVPDLEPESAFAAGYCLAHHKARSDRKWQRAQELWQNLEATKPVWK
ncbi:CHAD domain-containing protein [Roseibium sp. CAU 1637]|uniref:CHAD domain-containing protein n=1 Tax=Roseibium limicola TaxID=2816037 RepID=A0A939ERT9_9HYPH|nr:CHAD domain-containing protein [Roseibium limicola]MBO0346771.1 CHAD domain-containing protein [Roseibium limicola]